MGLVDDLFPPFFEVILRNRSRFQFPSERVSLLRIFGLPDDIRAIARRGPSCRSVANLRFIMGSVRHGVAYVEPELVLRLAQLALHSGDLEPTGVLATDLPLEDAEGAPA
jgi:hypothetical protein